MENWKWEGNFGPFTVISNEWQDMESAVRSLRKMEKLIEVPATDKKVISKDGEVIFIDYER